MLLGITGNAPGFVGCAHGVAKMTVYSAAGMQISKYPFITPPLSNGTDAVFSQIDLKRLQRVSYDGLPQIRGILGFRKSLMMLSYIFSPEHIFHYFLISCFKI